MKKIALVVSILCAVIVTYFLWSVPNHAALEDAATPNFCQTYGSQLDTVRERGWPVVTSDGRVNECTTYHTNHRPLGLVIDALPGVMILGVAIIIYRKPKHLHHSHYHEPRPKKNKSR